VDLYEQRIDEIQADAARLRLARIRIERDLDKALQWTWQARRRARQARLEASDGIKRSAEARRNADWLSSRTPASAGLNGDRRGRAIPDHAAPD
jgi:hypothetical protein